MDRQHWSRRIESLDPERDFAEIYRILSAHEFPWDTGQALGLALFRTYAVPSIGELLARTAEFTERTRKRYEDTGLLLDAVTEHGFTGTGRDAIRRINRMHGAYAISNDDFRYVLATFVVVPIRWIDRHGWRRLTEAERVATANHYRELGRHMGIRDIPATHREFAALLDAYEVRRLSLALLDAPLLDSFRYPHPRAADRRAATALLRLRAAVVRRMPPRMRPLYARDLPQYRSYRGGYDVSALGTFPGGCPVAHDRTG